MILRRATLSTPLGPMLALASDDALCALEFTGKGRRLTRLDARRRRWFPSHDIVDGENGAIRSAHAWLTGYFAGDTHDASDLRLEMYGAAFETRVWRALLEIPAGHTTSYGAIAKKLGTPGASRAVGAANGANPIAIIVPCHRVVGSSGSLVGYGGGLDRKTWLLDHERRWRTDTLF